MDEADLQYWIGRVSDLALCEVERGGLPFSALLADAGGRVLGEGVNRVAQDQDPTAHAEVIALRDAGRRHGRDRLPGTVLFASGEPCGLCYVAALAAGVSQVVFVVDRDSAARWGFDYRDTYAWLAAHPRALGLAVWAFKGGDGQRPFQRHAELRKSGQRRENSPL